MRHLRGCAVERRARVAGLALVLLALVLLAPAAARAQRPAAPRGTGSTAAAQAPQPAVSQPAVVPSPAAAVAAPPSATGPSATAPSDAGDGAYTLARPTVMRTAPDAAPVGELRAGAGVEVIGHDRGWVRVRTEAWVPASEIVPADTAYRAGLSAADLRADPEGTRGKVVRWMVQYIALETADPLRHGLATDEPYLLAKGPGAENAMLYLVVPPSLLGTARALTPLDSIAITARVRDGRSDPVGVPILDLQSIRRLQ